MQEMSDKLPPLKSYVWELGFFPVVEHQTPKTIKNCFGLVI
jgi:hypothetical protein